MIKHNRRQLGLLISTILFAATAIGVQRTVLSIYTQQLDQRFASYLILGAALALGIFGIAKAIGNYLGGNYSDKSGRRRLVRIGLAVLLIGSAIIVFANDLSTFLIANSIVGIGVGLLLAAATVMFTDIPARENRAKSLSLMELSVYTGTSIGAIFAGIVADTNIILAFIIATVLVLVATSLSIGLEETKDQGQGQDSKQLRKRKEKLSDLRDEWRGIAANYPFLPPEEIENLFSKLKSTRTSHFKVKRFEASQMAHPSILLTFSTGLVSRISDAAIILVFPLLILSRGYSTIQLGIFTSGFTLLWALGMLFSGSLADSIGRKIPVAIGLIIEFMGLGLLFIPALNMQFYFTLFAILLAGLGRGIYYPIPASIISDIIVPERRGQMLGVYRFILDFGYAIGAAMLFVLVELPITSGVSGSTVYESAFIVVLIILFIQTNLILLLLKDPRPNFRQFDLVHDHIEQVRGAMHKLSLSMFDYVGDDRDMANNSVEEAKQLEKVADQILETLVENTYSGAWEAVDAIELLDFSRKMDKALGHSLRSLRKLLLITDELPNEISDRLCTFAIMLDILVQEAVETINLLPVEVSLASQQSYRVNRAEIVLDEIHQGLFQAVMDFKNPEHSSSTVLLIQAIESLEKSANTVEDAVQIIRLVAMKHDL